MKHDHKTPFRAGLILMLFGIMQTLCTPPPRNSSPWDRYRQVTFQSILAEFKGYREFTQENTLRIYTPLNAFRGEFTVTGGNTEVTEEEKQVLMGKYKNEMDEQQIRRVYQHKALLKSAGDSAWFCFQEQIYPDLLALKPGASISVLYQFAGSTNAKNDPRFIFAVMGWAEPE
jgi:hypothetical protein